MAVNPTTWTRDTFIHEYRHAAARGENFSCNEDFTSLIPIILVISFTQSIPHHTRRMYEQFVHH